MFQGLIGRPSARIEPVHRFGIDDNLEQAAGRRGLRCARSRGAAVLEPVMVQAKASHDHDEPGGEFAPPVGGKGSESPIVLLTQPVHDKRITVHHHVVIAGDLPGDVQDQSRIGIEKGSPSLRLGGATRYLEKVPEFAWEGGGGLRTTAHVGHAPLRESRLKIGLDAEGGQLPDTGAVAGSVSRSRGNASIPGHLGRAQVGRSPTESAAPYYRRTNRLPRDRA